MGHGRSRHNAVKGPWLPEEDELLRKLVGEIGPKRWALIASNIPGRAGKQCRERWLNHLDTNVRKGEWTTEEDELLLATQHRVGNKWSEIARLLPGRAENAVKNRFNSLIAKQLPYGLSASLDVPEDDPRSMVKPEPGLDEDEAEAEEAALEAKKGKELLQYMFSKIGNQRRGPRIPQSPRTSTESFEFEGEDGEDDTDAPAEVELVDEHGAASRRPDRFRINLQLQEDSSDDDDDDDDAEQDEEDEDGMADGARTCTGCTRRSFGHHSQFRQARTIARWSATICFATRPSPRWNGASWRIAWPRKRPSRMRRTRKRPKTTVQRKGHCAGPRCAIRRARADGAARRRAEGSTTTLTTCDSPRR